MKQNFGPTPMVSIITVNYNNHQVTCEFLESIKQDCDYPNFELIIVDNGSKVDPTSQFKNTYQDAIVMLTGANLGFAGGNNVGIKAAKGEYLFLVNNDTEFTPGLIQSLVDTFRSYADAGLVCPKFQYYFNKGTIEYAGYNLINVFTGRNSMVGNSIADNGQFDKLSTTHYAHGGGMMISRKVLEKAGPMSEDYFLYYEELDWSEQIKQAGFKIYYQPAGLIYHKESASTGKGSPMKTFYLTRNRLLFMRRWMKFFNFFIFSVYFSLFTVPKNSLSFLVKGQTEHFKSFWKAIWWHLKGGAPQNKKLV